MQKPLSRLFSACALVIAGTAGAMAQAASPVTLQPHRVAYELSLDPARSGGAFQSARGLMVLEFSGNACDGYATNFRQVTELVGADGDSRALDFRVNLWEEGEGKSFRFTMRNAVNSNVTRDAQGEATRRNDGSISVVMRNPRGQKSDFDGNVLFPSMMSLALIRAAESGARSYEAKLFDGSESGEKTYDVAAVIGNPLEGDRNSRLEAPLRGNALDQVKRWPITISYFEDGTGDRTPAYRMRTVTFANGVLGSIVFEFPDFSLAAKAVKYEALPNDTCKR